MAKAGAEAEGEDKAVAEVEPRQPANIILWTVADSNAAEEAQKAEAERKAEAEKEAKHIEAETETTRIAAEEAARIKANCIAAEEDEAARIAAEKEDEAEAEI